MKSHTVANALQTIIKEKTKHYDNQRRLAQRHEIRAEQLRKVNREQSAAHLDKSFCVLSDCETLAAALCKLQAARKRLLGGSTSLDTAA